MYEFYGGAIATDASSINQNSWTHWVFAYNSSTLERNIYKDGYLVAEDTASGAYAGNLELILGVEHSANNGFVWGSALDAKFDDLSIWSKTLTQEEVQNYYSNSPNTSEDNLEVLYQFNAGEGTTLYDHSGNGNHGTINGATWSSDVPPIPGCTDSEADNYNEAANGDDGSCVYSDNVDYSLEFDGVDDWVKLHDSDLISNTQNHTVELWFKWLGIPDYDEFSSYGMDLYSENTRDGGVWRIRIQPEGVPSSTLKVESGCILILQTPPSRVFSLYKSIP
jgi:hypothetical protein